MKVNKNLIEMLRNYAETRGSYNFDPGIALMIANRMEQLMALAENGQSAIDTNKRLSEKLYGVETRFNVGDKIWVVERYDDDWYIVNKEGSYIHSIKTYVSEDNQIIFYMIKDKEELQEYSSRFCFGSYEECSAWCERENDK